MLKRILFSVVPMLLLVGTVTAEDNLLAKLANTSGDPVAQAPLELDESEFGAADVDSLLGAEENSDDDAIAACFRRIGYGYGYGYSTVRYNYGYSYNYCQPYYTSYTYYPVRVYRPVYTCYTPIYTSYWGCF